MLHKEKVLKIMELGLEVNKKIKNSFFMSYFGHTNSINIEIYYCGWEVLKSAVYTENVFLDLENADEKINKIIKKLEELKGE
jgi:hypothetical protein|nr:MAG TPA: hypothetical protein [Caudoviricetes sp.]